MFEIALPLEVETIIKLLEQAGFEAFVVGGCVRDSLLKKQFDEFLHLYPKDWDIATSAEPESIKKALEPLKMPIIATGIKHGTVSVFIDKKSYEITTYRIDGEYVGYRKPKEVFFVKNLKDDLYRRDFTMNAMAYHPYIGLCDPFGGKNDLQNKLIKAVGDANNRFKEDALRILRALRFASRFGFSIDIQTKEAIWSHKKLLRFISKERIREEIKGILCGSWVQNVWSEYADIISFALSEESDIFEQIIHNKEKILKTIAFCPQEFVARMAVLLSELQIPFQKIDKILEWLRFDKKSHKLILELTKYISMPFFEEKSWIKRQLNILGEENFRLVLKIKSAQFQNRDQTKEIMKIKKISDELEGIIEKKEAFSIKDLAINGNHLKELGISGRKIGFVFEAMLEAVINEKISNTQDELKKFVQKLSMI